MRDRFLSAGYAALIWDKPGFGESKGQFTEGLDSYERVASLKRSMPDQKIIASHDINAADLLGRINI